MKTVTALKKLVLFALCAVLVSASLASAVFAAVVEKADGVFVYDKADVIKDETEKSLNDRAKELKEKTGSEIVIVTVQNMGGDDGNKFAEKVFDELKLSEVNNDSVLVIFSAAEKHYHITPGSSICKFIDKEAIDKVFDAALVAETAGDYDARFTKIFDDLEAKVQEYQTQKSDSSSPFKWILIVLLVIVGVAAVIAVVMFFRRSKYVGTGDDKRRRYKTDRNNFVDVPEQSDIERARRREAAMNNRAGQQGAAGDQGQFRYPDGQRPQGQHPQGTRQQPQGQRPYPQGQNARPYPPQGQRPYPNGQQAQGQQMRRAPQGQQSRPYPNGPTREFESTRNVNVPGQRPTPNGPTREFESTRNFNVPGQRPQGQRPYPQGQRPYPNGQQPQGQRPYPQGQQARPYPQGQAPGVNAQNRRPAQVDHEHPTVYPDRAPYVSPGDSAPTDTTND